MFHPVNAAERTEGDRRATENPKFLLKKELKNYFEVH